MPEGILTEKVALVTIGKHEFVFSRTRTGQMLNDLLIHNRYI